MPKLPTGTVTFLFSDIEGSTRLLEALGHGYVALLQEHNRMFRVVIQEHEGAEVSTRVIRFVVFRSPLNAIDAAARIQRMLADWPSPAPVRVRIACIPDSGNSPEAATWDWMFTVQLGSRLRDTAARYCSRMPPEPSLNPNCPRIFPVTSDPQG